MDYFSVTFGTIMSKMSTDALHTLAERLKSLERKSSLLNPPQGIRVQWQTAVEEYTNNFLETLKTEKAYYQREKQAENSLSSIPKEGIHIHDLLKDYQSSVMEEGINAASQGHLGYIPGGGIYPSALGDYLAAVSNRYAGIYYAAPGAVNIENTLIRWMCDLMGFPPTSVGNLTSGGSISNLIAIVSARDAKGLKAADYHRSVFYLTEQTHHSLQKAIRIAGMAEGILRYIPVNNRFQMDTKALAAQIQGDRAEGLQPFFVNASLGTTNTGAVDDIAQIGAIASKNRLWFHVDAAYGGFFKLVESCSKYFLGIEHADSITLDPHKSLFLPFGTGTILIKDAKAALKSHYYLADYMQDSYVDTNQISPADVSPELTKHFRGLRMWFPLQLFGTAPFEAALQEKILLAQYFYYKINEITGFETGPFPELSITMFRYSISNEKDNGINQKLLEYIKQDGRIFLSSTTIDGTFWIRVAVLVFRTHQKDIDLLLDIIKTGINQLTEQGHIPR